MDAPPFPAAAIADACAAVKDYLRIEGSAVDTAITAATQAALTLGERFTGTAWIARSRQCWLDRSPDWQRLPVAPVTAIGPVERVTLGGAATTLPVDAYTIDLDARSEGWVRLLATAEATRVRVTFVAGTAAGWGDLPPPLAQGAILLAAHLIEGRGEAGTPPAAVVAFWRPWRRLQLMAGVRRSCWSS
ncbi:head-tail connector protein [Sphingomonas sp. TDK1]|uniref:head-tail connector protein n=1 Tax=Sphingomonas sp. TDK1 TaxID=453247 RepID=UPI0007D9C2E3|nr:hypothetical protein [Sphingomonas sp. TDK1]OAN64836.1 hypothetical protein A7X12_17520 [Sphingomonas sp. TDK1]